MEHIIVSIHHFSPFSRMDTDRLVEVLDNEVSIDFTLNCKCRANVRLRSLCASFPVAFKVQTSSPEKFLVNPPTGLVPPLSYATLQVILKPQTQPPPSFPRSPSDRFLIKTAPFPVDSSVAAHPDTITSWFSTLPRRGASVQDIKLKVAFVGPFLLHHAVRRGDCDAVRSIIKRQRPILSELASEEAECLLRVSTGLANSEDMVNILLESGLRIEERAKSTDNARLYDCVDPRWEAKGWSALHVAVAFNRTEEIPCLVKGRESRELDWRDNVGRTPLHVAASKGNIKCAKLLVEAGADKDCRSNNGRTALHKATTNKDRSMVELLIAMGADPTIPDDRGRTPFDVARDNESEDIVTILERGEQVLMVARRGEPELLESLLQNGASMNYSDQYGLTALHAAAIKGHMGAAMVLLQYGFELDCKDNEGHEPLHMAVESGSLEMVELLVSKGGNVNAMTNIGTTTLNMARAMGYDDISNFLISKGASSTY